MLRERVEAIRVGKRFVARGADAPVEHVIYRQGPRDYWVVLDECSDPTRHFYDSGRWRQCSSLRSARMIVIRELIRVHDLEDLPSPWQGDRSVTADWDQEEGGYTLHWGTHTFVVDTLDEAESVLHEIAEIYRKEDERAYFEGAMMKNNG